MIYFDPSDLLQNWYIRKSTLEEFVLGMLSLGYPLEVSLVGNFDTEGRGSRRDINLPLHRDGEYSQKLAEKQGGQYVEKKNIHIVGLYCIREGGGVCKTLVDDDEVELKQGEGLVFDNQKVLHGRKGEVGNRILLRFWVQRKDNP